MIVVNDVSKYYRTRHGRRQILDMSTSVLVGVRTSAYWDATVLVNQRLSDYSVAPSTPMKVLLLDR